MTDYLELMFLPDAEKGQDGEDIPVLPGVKAESEPVEFREISRPEAEDVMRISTKIPEDGETFALRTARSEEEPILEGAAQKIARPGLRKETGRRTEELERRLRRESRRYDSGFYRY